MQEWPDLAAHKTTDKNVGIDFAENIRVGEVGDQGTKLEE
jgi:hypothetical protein